MEREQPQTALWFYSAEAHDLLCPAGYTPMSRNEVVRRCAHKIADMVSNMTLMLMENGDDGDRRVKNELSRKLDIYPNAHMTRKGFIYRLVTDLILYGNALVLPRFSGVLLDDLRPLPAAGASYMPEGDGYRIFCAGRQYKPDELLHFVLNPDDEQLFRGRGFADQLRQTLDTLLQANATKTGFMQSKWKPSVVISINSDIQELQDPEKRRKILGSYAAETERGEPWLIPAGELDIKTISPLTLQDLAIQDSITLDTRAVAAALGIPPFLVGVGDFQVNAYNNFVATTIMSYATIIQQELTKKLLYNPAWYFRFNPKSLMQYSLAEKSGFVNAMVGGGLLNRNEGRNEFDYTPVDAPGMNDYAVLENYIKVGDIDKQKKLVQDGSKKGEGDT